MKTKKSLGLGGLFIIIILAVIIINIAPYLILLLLAGRIFAGINGAFKNL